MPAPRKSRATSKAAAPAPAATPAPAKSEVKGSGTALSPKVDAAKSRVISYDDIAKRAYEIYASRGYAPGNPDEDWHEAERQLRAGL